MTDPKNPPRFKLGDRVSWTSSSNGGTKTKVGRVVEVVPCMYGISTAHREFGLRQEALPRDHESYVVHVSAGPKAKGKRYWPRVAALVKVQ